MDMLNIQLMRYGEVRRAPFGFVTFLSAHVPKSRLSFEFTRGVLLYDSKSGLVSQDFRLSTRLVRLR